MQAVWRTLKQRRVFVVVAVVALVAGAGAAVAAVAARTGGGGRAVITAGADDGINDSTTAALSPTGESSTSADGATSTTTSLSLETTTSEGASTETTTVSCGDACTSPSPPPAVPVVTLGSTSHSCALLADGHVECWGDNSEAQLGNDDGGSRNTAGLIPGIENATALAVGETHTCVVVAGGHVDCWGEDTSGQLGDLDPAPQPPEQRVLVATPVEVVGLTNASDVAAGDGFSCALLHDGRIDCWGSNSEGGLGTTAVPAGGKSWSARPVAVDGVNDATQVAADRDHACAIVGSGQVRCWGSPALAPNNDGRASPIAVSGVTNATRIDVGASHACAVLADGRVECWGQNDSGQLGDGTTTDSLNPVFVTGVGDATAIATGYNSSCAVVTDGAVKCWGSNGFLALGNGDDDSGAVALTPVEVAGVRRATLVAGHLDTMCALSAAGPACWGANESGQVGDGIYDNTSTPQPVVRP